MKKNILTGLAIAALTVSSTTAFAGNANGHDKTLVNPNTPSLTVVNTISHVNGSIAGNTGTHFVYPISGVVYATVTDDDTGVPQGGYEEVGSISATALFGNDFQYLMGPWDALPATLPWTMSDDFAMIVEGTTFTFEEILTGRAFPHLGPVENPAVTGTMALRMSGCAGLRANDEGEYAGKVGTLCLNGTFTFNQAFEGVGVSNCSIAIHEPLM